MILLNGSPVPVTHFPDNTSQVWKLPILQIRMSPVARIQWEFSHEGEFMHLAQLKTLLDAENFPASLELKYLPYGRQDKAVSNSATFGLHTFATLINSLNFTVVSISDPHSEVALELIKDSIATYPTDRVAEIMQKFGADLVCYPDKGANSKYSKLYDYPHVFGNKTRDQDSGLISGYELYGEVYGKKILIVDDICDGGATFKILTKRLLDNGAKSVALFVTHGIFSKGVRTLIDAGIARVFTADGEVGPRHNSQNI